MRQGSKQGTIKTTNPQSVTLAGTIQPFAGDTSSWPVINGVKQKRGWAVCEGAVLEQSTYPDLFANLGSTWNAFNHPSDGTPTVGGSQFALPNLKGLYLGGAGANGDSTFTLGSFAADLTGANGLSNSSSSVSATGAKTQLNSNQNSHTHGWRYGGGTGSTDRMARSLASSSTLANTSTEGKTITWSGGTFSVSGTASAQSISGDAETRPKTAPVGYIIALYDNVAANALGLPEASASQSGTVTTGTQTFAGDKTFDNNIKVNGKILAGDATGASIYTQDFGVDSNFRHSHHRQHRIGFWAHYDILGGNGSQERLYFDSATALSIFKPGGGSFADSSDERLKENITPYKNALDVVSKLNVVEYNWKTEKRKDLPKQVGFIAQEVQKIKPEWVLEGGDPEKLKDGSVVENVMALSLGNDAIAILVSAIQELKNKLDAAEARIEALENLD